MSHAHHDSLPDSHPDMLLYDGCPECEQRVTDSPLDALLHLDETRQLEAWRLMRAFKWSGGEGVDRPLSGCEYRLVNALYLVGVWMQRGGIEPEEIEARFERRLLEVRATLGMLTDGEVGRLAAIQEAADPYPGLRDVARVDLGAWTPGQRDALRIALEGSVDAIHDHGTINLLFGGSRHAPLADLPADAAKRAMAAGDGLRELARAVDVDVAGMVGDRRSWAAARDERVERVARAMADRAGPHDQVGGGFDDMIPPERQRYRELALAAIEAI